MIAAVIARRADTLVLSVVEGSARRGNPIELAPSFNNGTATLPSTWLRTSRSQ